jgi:hypothetical protein
MLEFLRIKRFKQGQVYITYGVDHFFQYKIRVLKRHKNGAIEYSHPDGGQWMVAISRFDLLSWCECVTVRCSIFHDGMITFYANRPAQPIEEEQP